MSTQQHAYARLKVSSAPSFRNYYDHRVHPDLIKFQVGVFAGEHYARLELCVRGDNEYSSPVKKYALWGDMLRSEPENYHSFHGVVGRSAGNIHFRAKSFVMKHVFGSKEGVLLLSGQKLTPTRPELGKLLDLI